jgi:hypothetical protein
MEASRRWRNRVIVGVFAVATLVFIVSPPIIKWWGVGGVCPTEITAKGRSSGTDWEVAKSDCGAEVGTVWQVRIIPTKGYSNLAYDARQGGPVPLAYEQAGFKGTITLAEPPAGSTETKVAIELGPQGRPVAPIRFVEGKRVN